MQERLEICESICQEIIKKTISSNDLFPSRGISFTNFVKMSLNISKFGEIRLNLLGHYLENYHKISQQIQKYIQTHPLEHAMHIASLTMLRMGVGESNILTNAVYLQLIKNHSEFNFGLISLENAQNEKHFFILISETLPSLQENLATALLSLSTEAIVVDPFLKFVGPANQYTEACEDFLNHYVFEKISCVKPKIVLSVEQFRDLENHTDRVFQSLMDRHIPTFLSKEFLDLALTGYAFITRKIRADVPLIDNLKTTTLPFFGLCEQETQQIDAVAEIKTAEQKAIAEDIQQHLESGRFFPPNKKSFFVIPAITSNEGLIRKIYQHYPVTSTC